MDVSFMSFLQSVTSSPVLLITVLLTLGVIFVNGWTDAPNAIATCITTRCMSTRSAIWMSAIFNFLGVFVMTQINSSVASTISNMVDFGGNTREALIALCAALFSIVVYSVGASYFGIPTSESHSLIAGLSGAAIAIQNGIGGINMDEWAKVLYGLVLSLILGFATGWVVCKVVSLVCYRMDRRKTNRFFRGAQIFGAAAMSLSSFCVVSNALRLNFFDLHRADRDRKIKAEKKKKEKKIMEKTLKIEGMMCGHCEARVKKALEAVPGVESAAVSHEAGTAVVTLKEDVAYDVLKKAVEDQDYKVID